ncbi:N-acetyltransferase [Nonomuraea terrae]|uniref:N-acetyltransferase n=1 Tax=Nonomuraea terrae TaxID=2530383 RepID=A0A4R4Z337_9ACTN|nr:GNAT family N-acetyltransferase [Nonomuraea terrae]TDD51309.1 N-acetyltransferase [Nonomuraea terrae]
MRIERIEGGGAERLAAALHAAYSEGSGDPGPPISRSRFVLEIVADRPADRVEAWAAVEDGEVAGGYGLSFPILDNRHMAWLFPLVVRPARRGRGLGTALFEHALGRMRADNRRLLLAETPVVGAGAAFARARGMTVALVEARRTLDLRRCDWAKLERMVPQAPGYSLEHWTGPAAPELMPDVATLMNGMNDAPRDSGVDDFHFTADQIRAREERMAAADQTAYTVIARRDSDGAPAGFTRILLDADHSHGWAVQTDTTVLAGHRGHRLGLLLKLTNLFRLREREPRVERIITWNATSNAHMLAINEAMGFELFDEWYEWRLTL